MEKNQIISKEYFKLDTYTSFAICSDIGGTKTRLAIFGKKENEKIEQIFSFTQNSIEIKNFSNIINEVLKFAFDEYKISAENMNAIFGVPGLIEENRTYSKPTNLPWAVDVKKITKETYLKKIILLNDFEIIGYGIDLLDKKELLQLNDASAAKKVRGSCAVIGAGTGLGVCVLYFDKLKKQHITIQSDGGHMTMPSYTEEDFEIGKFIMKQKKYSAFPGMEQFVSGQGLVNTYSYFSNKLKKKNKLVELADDKAAEIAKQADTDFVCKTAMDYFLKSYGRAASNIALTALPTEGLYIAGGIAPKLTSLIKNGIFIEEFENNYRLKEILKSIPVFVVLNPEVGLLGAANAAFNFFEDIYCSG